LTVSTLSNRVTPELEYLQVKWAADLPYRQATAMLNEVLRLDKGISFSGTRDRKKSSTLTSNVTSRSCPRSLQTDRFANPAMSPP